MVQRYISHSIPNTLHYSSEIHPYVGEFPYLCADKRCRFGTLMNIPGGLPQPYHAV